jgi:hypothetical protein
MAVFLQANLAEKPTFSNFCQDLHNMLRLKGRVLDLFTSDATICIGGKIILQEMFKNCEVWTANRTESLAGVSLFGEVVGSQQRIPDSRPGIPTLDEA